MDARNAPFNAVLKRLQESKDAQLTLKFVSNDGNTALTILSIRPETVTVGVMTAEIVLPQALGRLTLDAHDLDDLLQLPGTNSWKLNFGPLNITIEFTGAP